MKVYIIFNDLDNDNLGIAFLQENEAIEYCNRYGEDLKYYDCDSTELWGEYTIL